MSDGKPIVHQGDPTSPTCRHCRESRIIVRGFLFCQKCDAGQVDNRRLRPTWMGEPE